MGDSNIPPIERNNKRPVYGQYTVLPGLYETLAGTSYVPLIKDPSVSFRTTVAWISRTRSGVAVQRLLIVISRF